MDMTGSMSRSRSGRVPGAQQGRPRATGDPGEAEGDGAGPAGRRFIRVADAVTRTVSSSGDDNPPEYA